MAYPKLNEVAVYWDNPPGEAQGVTIVLNYGGCLYQRHIGPRGWVTQREAAKLLGISIQAFNKRVRRGEFRTSATNKNGVSVVRLSDVKRLMLERQQRKGRGRAGARTRVFLKG